MSSRSERLRLGAVFLVLGAIALVVLVRLGDLQIVRAAHVSGDRNLPLRTRALPAPRGTIVDRHGEPLAFDRPVFEVRVEVERFPGMPTKEQPADPAKQLAAKDRLVADLLWALGRDQVRFGEPAAREDLRARLDARVERARKRNKPRFNILVERTIDDAGVIEALRSLDYRAPADREGARGPGYRLYFDMQLRYERVYSEPVRAAGVIGSVQAGSLTRGGPDGETVLVDDRVPVSGLERLAILEPGAAGAEVKLVDALSRAIWTGRRTEPQAGAVLRTTLDRDLQVRADIEIGAAADGVTSAYDSPPEWGAMVLVHVPTGGILAAASYTAAKDGSRDRYGAFAPNQCRFEPGSIVKPLHMAMSVDRGHCRWDERIDCSGKLEAGAEYGIHLRKKRLISDSHPNGVLTPKDVLIVSSNIGAVRLGLRLGPEGLDEYIRHYEFASSAGVLLPGEPEIRAFPSIATLPPEEQYAYTGPSVLFGYQFAVTPLQVARAYLTFLSRRERELRIVDEVELDGARRRPPAESPREPFFGQQALDLVKDALVGVVEDEEHGTARRVGTWLRKLRAEGHPYLEIAGKTGTSQYKGRGIKWNGEPFHGDIRTASFVGFTPVREPRYLVVCVLQKAGAGSFYGGTYAAPAASRLLVRALERETVESTASADRSGSGGGGGGTGPGGPDNQKRR